MHNDQHPSSLPDDALYERRVRAWTLYDWANSAFATTMMAAVLPVYYSKVAAATLADPALATAVWSAGLSFSLLISALLAPVLGTISDVAGSKKKFLALFAAAGIVCTGAMALVDRGDWILASALFIIARIGFTSGNVFYDALLPHVARADDQDRVSARGYAVGYLGGGLLLAINVVMIKLLPGSWGPRLSFLSVAVWWAVFSIPLFRHIPEPTTTPGTQGVSVVVESFKRLWATLHEVRKYRELFKLLFAFLIYNDGIGTIIGVATIYGAELGFGSMELVLALLLVQVVGIPFSLMFGRLPNGEHRGRATYLAFLLINIVALPVAGTALSRALPTHVAGSHGDPNNHLGIILGLLLALQLLCFLLAATVGKMLVRTWAAQLTTKRCVLLALGTYAVIATWGYFVSSVVEFWFLAWMVGMVQGGSQALSRSLYASLTPPHKSGELFGLFGVMEKMSAVLGPLLFATAVALFGSSRPAILSLIAFFVIGGWLLARVDVEAGRRAARQSEPPPTEVRLFQEQ